MHSVPAPQRSYMFEVFLNIQNIFSDFIEERLDDVGMSKSGSVKDKMLYKKTYRASSFVLSPGAADLN